MKNTSRLYHSMDYGVVYTSVTSVYHDRLWYNVLIS